MLFASLIPAQGVFSAESLLREPWETAVSGTARQAAPPDIFKESMDKQLGYVMLAGYQKLISPQLNSNCQFSPSCSEYAKQAVIRYGFFRGWMMGIERLTRCNRGAMQRDYEVTQTERGYRLKDGPEDNLLKHKER